MKDAVAVRRQKCRGGGSSGSASGSRRGQAKQGQNDAAGAEWRRR